jgi:hypothetical protein
MKFLESRAYLEICSKLKYYHFTTCHSLKYFTFKYYHGHMDSVKPKTMMSAHQRLETKLDQDFLLHFFSATDVIRSSHLDLVDHVVNFLY